MSRAGEGTSFSLSVLAHSVPAGEAGRTFTDAVPIDCHLTTYR